MENVPKQEEQKEKQMLCVYSIFGQTGPTCFQVCVSLKLKRCVQIRLLTGLVYPEI